MLDEDVRQFRSQVRLLQRRLRRENPPVSGLYRSSMQVLGALTRMPGGSQPGHVADELRMTSSNVAAALRELEAAGFIRRQKDPADARRAKLFVTDSGSAAIAEFRNERDTWFGRAVAARLTDQEQQTLVAAGHLLARLADFELEPAQ